MSVHSTEIEFRMKERGVKTGGRQLLPDVYIWRLCFFCTGGCRRGFGRAKEVDTALLEGELYCKRAGGGTPLHQ